MQPEIIACRPLAQFRLWVRFRDGAEGEVDLSHLRGKGVFAAWDRPGGFEAVTIDPESHTVCWPGGIDLDPYLLYSQITGASLPGQPRRAAS